MKKLIPLCIAAVLCFGVLLVGFTELNNSGWESIAKTVIAETSKATANFKITQGERELVVDGNKLSTDFSYYTKYMSKENGARYYYKQYDGKWYKAPQAYIPSMTLWESEAGDSVLGVLRRTLADSGNVKDLGDGKYTYGYVAEIGPAVVGWNPVFEYTFITDGARITEIEFRGATYKITYGGQSVFLPDAVEPAKLSTPQNLEITDGVLSWDAVDGATDYYIEIYRGLSYYMGAQTVQTNSFDIYSRIASQDWMLKEWAAAGALQITVRADFPVFSYISNSDESAPKKYVFNR